jgi:hypothetical protein
VDRRILKGAFALAIVVATAVALAAAQSRSAATAADPPQPRLSPHLLSPAGFGKFAGDVRKLPHVKPRQKRERPEPKVPDPVLPGPTTADGALQTAPAATSAATSGASFQGLDHDNFGAGWPPDPSGDVGPNHYVQTVNTSVGIYDKSGTRLAATTFDALFAEGATGTPCDNSNQGDPVTLYDPFGDRFIVSDFAWADAQYSTGPFYQCMAVSKTSDPVNGGWWFYAWQVESGASLPDYPKLGVWPDGIYMSANVFATTGSGSFQNAQVWVFNREQMEAGNPNAQGVSFVLPRTIGGITVFSLLPSNARAVTGAPPAGAPNYFTSIWGSYAIRTWKFHVDWSNVANSTFTGPTNSAVSTFNVGPNTVPEKDGNNLDTLTYRLMMQNQYTNIGGRESLWLTHTVGSGGTPNLARLRWYELPVTGGTISSPRQQGTYAPSDTLNRFMPSLAVDKNGDMAIGYSVSNASMYPALRYTGRLAGDPLHQLTQGESVLVQGLGFQCCTFSDGSLNERWGDYSSMTIDPDGCTFWYTGEYYDAHPTTKAEDNWLTRIGSFTLPGCSGAVAAPSISGFSPTSGSVGTSVTINGSDFTGASAVTFNGTSATFTVGSSTQITATVPSGATSGPIAVTTSGGTATSAASFTVTVPPPSPPTISGFTPTSGPVGTSVTISGSNFTGATSVTFNGAAAVFAVNSAAQITATVPSGATSGPVAVTTSAGTATSAGSFTVTVPVAAPTISGFTPTSGPAGTTVTINGSNFSGATSVTFKAKPASFTVISATQITATVPPGAKSGPIGVTTPAGTAKSSTNFTVTRR